MIYQHKMNKIKNICEDHRIKMDSHIKIIKREFVYFKKNKTDIVTTQSLCDFTWNRDRKDGHIMK